MDHPGSHGALRLFLQAEQNLVLAQYLLAHPGPATPWHIATHAWQACENALWAVIACARIDYRRYGHGPRDLLAALPTAGRALRQRYLDLADHFAAADARANGERISQADAARAVALAADLVRACRNEMHEYVVVDQAGQARGRPGSPPSLASIRLRPTIAPDHPLLSRTFRASGYQDTTLADLVAMLRLAGNPLVILLFGSQARGNPRPQSDIDFLVLVPQRRRTRALWARLVRVLRLSPVPCDVLLTSPKALTAVAEVPGFAEYDALREGICLYRRPRRHAGAAHLLAEQEVGGTVP